MKALGIAITGMIAISATAFGEITLTDIKGNVLSCEIAEATPDSYTLIASGKRIKITPADLAVDSQAAALRYARDQGVYRTFPNLNVQVFVGTRRRAVGYYMKTMDIQPSFSIAGPRLEKMPKGTATMIIITMDTGAKYTSRQEVLRVFSTETIDVPAAETGDMRKLEFKGLTVSYDGDRDNTNVGGDIYKYYVFGLLDEEGNIVDFQTNYLDLSKHVQNDPGARKGILKWKASDSVPEDLAKN